MHRSALPDGMYECQTRSKKWRQMDKIYGSYFDLDRYYEELIANILKRIIMTNLQNTNDNYSITKYIIEL